MSEEDQTAREGDRSRSGTLAVVITYLAFGLLLYTLSTGPVVGLSVYYLTETGDDRVIEYVNLFYLPFLMLPHDSSFMQFMEWYVHFWVEDVFQLTF